MTDITAQFAFAKGKRSAYERLYGSILRGFNGYVHTRSRRDRIDALQAKSDAELARLGIRRDQIAYHVFRDLFYV